jgi:hypothetical protein
LLGLAQGQDAAAARAAEFNADVLFRQGETAQVRPALLRFRLRG